MSLRINKKCMDVLWSVISLLYIYHTHTPLK
jgi:hypothetical protein